MKGACEREEETGGGTEGELLQAERQQDECMCTVRCTVYCTKATSSTQEALAGIKYCPGMEMELPKYVHMEYKGSSSRSWPVQYQYCAGRVTEEMSIPRVEITDVSLEQAKDGVSVKYNKAESWSTNY